MSLAWGIKGVLLGWTPMVKGKIRAQALSNLRRFQAGRDAAG